jgi:PAS domain S-box-containing protein
MSDLSFGACASLVDNLPHALALISSDGRLLTANRCLRTLLSADGDASWLVDMLPSPASERDGGSAGCETQQWDALLPQAGRRVRVTVTPIADGAMRLVSVMEIPPDETDGREPSGARELHCQVLDSAPAGLFIASATGVVEFWNTQLEEATGLSRREMIGRSLFGDGSPFVTHEEAFRRAAAGEEVVLERQSRHLRDGQEVMETLHFQPVCRNGAVAAVAGWITDVSEQASLERQLIRSERMVAVGELAAGVAHNFNNILASIGGDAQLLKMLAEDEHLDEAVAHSADLIYRETMRGGRIAHDLLSFARGQEPSLTEVDVLGIAEEAIRLARTYPNTGAIDMRVERREDLARAVGDAGQLHQVFFNLILNAVQAMPDGGSLTVEGRVVPRRDGVAVVETRFTDTGVGIPADQLERVFDPFFTNRRNGTMGTGLGLSVSLAMVRGMGGDIRIESVEGEGTSVVVSLPIVERRRRPRTGVAPRVRVLLADDEPNVRRTLAAFLGRRGYDTVACRDGAEVLQLLEPTNHGFAAVILDLVMPRVSGIEALKRLRKSHPNLPVIVVTGVAATPDLAEIESLHVAAILPKPVNFEALADAVASATAPSETLAAAL